MSYTFKKLKELFLNNIEEEKKQLVEINSYLEKMLEFSKKLDNDYAKKIQTAFREYNTKKLASTKISKAYKDKLSNVKLNKLIADELCSITGTQEIYRKNILILLNKNIDPKDFKDLKDLKDFNFKLSNMYFYYCKFGNKILGYYEKTPVFEKFKSVINEIVGCVFVNISFRSTNLNNIKFKTTRFLNISNSKKSTNYYYNFLQRSSEYKTIKANFKTNDTLEIDNAQFISSTFDNCLFLNVKFVNNYFGLNENLDPIFNECRFIDGTIDLRSITLDHSKKPTKRSEIENNANIINYSSLASNLVVKKNGQIEYNLRVLSRIPNFICEKTKFINFNFQSEKDFSIELYLYKKCSFNSSLFKNVKFKENNFLDCSFNNVTFDNCIFFNVYFKECKFYNCKFLNSHFGNHGITEFNNCKIISCEFNGGIWHNWLLPICTTIINSTTVINECKFINLVLPGYKFNNDSEYNIREDNGVLMDMTKNDFICCNMFGTNFDNCNLEGSRFAARTTCISYFNWFGSIYKFNTNKPSYGINKSKEFKKLSGSEENYNKFLLHFQGVKKEDKLYRLGIQHLLRMRYNEYTSLNIDVNKLREAETKIDPYDYFEVPTYGFYQIIPATSMFNTNIKNCNFQSIDGFQSFDFTQVAENEKGHPDLTATNLTHVRLEYADFSGCNLIGTVFQVADIKGANFTNTIVNNNTDFENTMNVELVPYQEEDEVTRRRFVRGSINTDTGRGLEFSDLQQQANETHARSQHVIDNRDKFEELLNSMKIPKNTNILAEMKHYLSNVQHIPLDIINTKIISNSEEKIIDFLNKLVVISNKILDSESDLPEGPDKKYIKENFVKGICNYLAKRLNFNSKEKDTLINNFKEAFTDEFLNISDAFLKILLSFKKDSNNQKWCWLQFVTLSLKFLISNTEMYIFMFIQYYFNEIFNAHGKGSRSCTLGMVERLMLIHSQASEGYLMTLKMDSNELKNLSSTINSITKYNPANPSIKDSKIDENFIKEFNKPDSHEKYHHKYIYNKLINIIKPNSKLPESKEYDLGFDFDYNISTIMRDECSRIIKEKIDKEEISTIQEICETFVETMQTLIIENNNISRDESIFYREKANDELKKLFKKKLNAIKEHLETTEVEFLKMDIVIMCGENFTTEDISKYFDPDLEKIGGLKYIKKNKSRKAKGLSLPLRNNPSNQKPLRRTKSLPILKNTKSILDKIIIKKLKELPYDDRFKKLFNKIKPKKNAKSLTMDNRRKLSLNGNKVTRKAKSLTLDNRRKLSLNGNKVTRKAKSFTLDNRRKLSLNGNKVTRKAKSLTLDNKIKLESKLPISEYQEISLKNMNIQDKPYKNAIKKYYLKTINNYVKKIETMSTSKIKYGNNYQPIPKSKPKSKSKSKSKSSNSSNSSNSSKSPNDVIQI
jgi:uncharacterized protein YjbI with pentapeptide repeats